MKVYLAGPITGQTWSGAHDWRAMVGEQLIGRGIEFLDPLRGKGFLKDLVLEDDKFMDRYPREHPLTTGHSIMHRDMWDVSRCDVVFANFLEAERVSIGTVMEIAWARTFGKYTIMVIEKDTVHDHGMLTEAASVVLPTLEDALDILWMACDA